MILKTTGNRVFFATFYFRYFLRMESNAISKICVNLQTVKTSIFSYPPPPHPSTYFNLLSRLILSFELNSMTLLHALDLNLPDFIRLQQSKLSLSDDKIFVYLVIKVFANDKVYFCSNGWV